MQETRDRHIPSAGRIPELDGIRGIAIAMVLLHHYFFGAIEARPGTLLSYALIPGRLTWSGVDLFFVLSGFLIGGILLDARLSSNYFQVFYTRRFFRIVPIYAICIAVSFLAWRLTLVGLFGGLSWMAKDQLPWTPYLVFLQNFWMAHGNTYGLFGLGVTWSLAVEEQFYLTLPIVIRFLRPKRVIVGVLSGILAAPMARVVLHAVWPDHPYSWVVLTLCRADALLLGVLGAIALRDARWRAKVAENRERLRYTLALFATGFLYLTIRSADAYGQTMLTIGFTWLASFYLCVLIYGLTFREGWISRCLRWYWLRWLGGIAYGVYLMHEFVRALFFGLLWSRPPNISGLADLGVSLLALGTTFALCQLSWTHLEKPMIRLGHANDYQFEKADAGSHMTGLAVEVRGS